MTLGLMPFRSPQRSSNVNATPHVTVAGTHVVTGDTPHQKTAWTQAIAATPHDGAALWLCSHNTAATATQTDALLDIGIGGSGSEQVLVADLLIGYSPVASRGGRGLVLPLAIPKGSRLAVRAQSLQTSKAINTLLFVQPVGSAAPWPTFVRCEAIGINGAASQGTSHTPGSTGSESSWADIGSPTTKAYGAVFPMVQGPMGTTMDGNAYHIEIGIGGVTIDEWYFSANTGEELAGPMPPLPAWKSIPAGAQLQIRGESQVTGQALDMAIYGLC